MSIFTVYGCDECGKQKHAGYSEDLREWWEVKTHTGALNHYCPSCEDEMPEDVESRKKVRV